MDETGILTLALFLPGLIILGGFAVLITAMLRRGKVAEMQHRERMAMIERGMTPPSVSVQAEFARRSHGSRMTLGVILCGLGLAFVMLITFAAGEPGVAIGIGGALVMLGLAFIVSASITKPEPPQRHDPPSPPAA